MLRELAKKLSILSSLFLGGCFSTNKTKLPSIAPENVTTDMVERVQSLNNLSILSAIGGFCLLAGMVLLVLTRGSMGWRAILGGSLMIVVNYLIALYASWIFIPVVVVTGAISIAWGWKIIVKIINDDKSKIKEIISV